jgi:DNA polymerase-3 subunit epsilon
MKYIEDSVDNKSLFLWLDTETSGLNPKTCGLIEVAGFFELEGTVFGEFELLMNPFTYPNQIEIQETALAVNNRTIPEIQTFLDQRVCLVWLMETIQYYTTLYKTNRVCIIGYNVKFDVDFIQEWFNANNMKYSLYFQYKYIDIMQQVMFLSYLNIIDPFNNTLKDMCLKFGIDITNAHTAIADIKATYTLSKKLTSITNLIPWINPEIKDINENHNIANWGSKKVTENAGIVKNNIIAQFKG